MPKYIAALTIIFLIGAVITRVRMLKKRGIEAMNFGKIDKKDYIIPPFALFYFYMIFANTFNLPAISRQEFIHSELAPWAGVLFCLGGLVMMIASLVSFGESFRVGIDAEHPDKLITSGIFTFSRNPIYVAFGSVLLGQFLVFPNWILLIYLGAAIWLFHRQILREEEYLKSHYGQEYMDYSTRVRRYL